MSSGWFLCVIKANLETKNDTVVDLSAILGSHGGEYEDDLSSGVLRRVV
jgi:hypothetical protein